MKSIKASQIHNNLDIAAANSFDSFVPLIGQITEEEADEIEDHANYNARKPSDRELGGMHDKTRTLLQKFYGPYNEDLASILGDTRFLWNDTEQTDINTTVATTTTTES